MGIIVRQSISNTIISYIGITLGFVLTILLYPHILTPEEYGLTRVLISAAYISSQFAHFGLHNVVIRYYPFFKNANPDQHGFLFWLMSIPIIGFLLFTAVYLLAGDLIINVYAGRSPLFVEYYLWVIPLTLFILYYDILNNYLRSLRDSTTGSIANEVIQRILAIGLLGIYFFGFISIVQFITLFVFSYISQPLIIGYQIWKKREFKLIPDLSIIRTSLVKGVAKYSVYSMLGGFTTVIVWNVDVIMLGSMAGLDQTAVYAIAFYVASIITIPQRSIEKIAGPLLAAFIKNKEWTEVDSIYKKTSLNQVIPGLLFFGLIWINLELLFLIMPEFYAAGKWVVFIVGIGKLIVMVSGANGLILINSKHYKISFYTNILLVLVTVVANYLLIPVYGIEGAAIATALALFTHNVVKWFYLLIRQNLQPFSLVTLFVVASGAISIYICYAIIDTGNVWVNVPLKSVLFVLFFMGPIFYLNISPDLNNLLKSFYHKWKK